MQSPCFMDLPVPPLSHGETNLHTVLRLGLKKGMFRTMASRATRPVSMREEVMADTGEIRSILVATGLGGESDAPIRMAGFLTERTAAELHLLHALELAALPARGSSEPPPNFRALVERTDQELDRQAEAALPEGIVPASTEVIIFVPHKAILNRALQVSADLIVLGAHRRRPNGDSLLGPTPDRVIRSAAAPCLIVPPIEPRPFRKVVAAIDIQMPASAALDLAQIWAARFGADIVEGAEVQVLYTAPTTGGEAELKTAIQREIDRSRERIGQEGAVSVYPVIRYGKPPANEIVRYLEEVDADLVVLGTRGFGALRRALIGSVASTVGRRAPCPVLLVPPVLWRGTERG